MAEPAANPLDQLRDIHLPDPVGLWPPAPGWWLLLCICLALLFALSFWLVQRYRSRLYRREALQQMHKALQDWRADGDSAVYLMRASSLLKRVALISFGRRASASLVGESWTELLDRSGRTREFSYGKGQVLMFGQYSQDVRFDPEALHRLGCDWVRRHSTREARHREAGS